MKLENLETKKVDASTVADFLKAKGIAASASMLEGLNNSLDVVIDTSDKIDVAESLLRKSTLYYWFDQVSIRANQLI